MMLGSVSRYAAMQACCPVVVVREETSAVHREIVIGIRDPRDTDAALAYAFDEAALRGATLIAVHSWNSLPAASTRQRRCRAHRGGGRPILAEALRTWRDKYPAVPVWHDVVHDHPAHVLASYAAAPTSW